MERVSQGSKTRLFILIVAILVALPFLPIRAVEAGTVFQSPDPMENTVEPLFPDSAFGKPPAKTNPKDTFAAKESSGGPESAAADEEDTSEGSRSPASVSEKHGSRSVASFSGAASESQVPEVQPASIRRKGIQEIAIIAGDLGYFPKTFFVSRDVPVRLYVTGSSKQPLCIMMDSFQVKKQVRSQKVEEITFTPNTPGTYRFYCPINGMEGMMVVKELVSAQPSQPSQAGQSSPSSEE